MVIFKAKIKGQNRHNALRPRQDAQNANSSRAYAGIYWSNKYTVPNIDIGHILDPSNIQNWVNMVETPPDTIQPVKSQIMAPH